MRRGNKVLLVSLAVVAIVAVAARAAAPEIVERYVNRELADMGEYRGSIAEVDLHLLRGGYAIRDLQIVKVGSEADVPFVTMPRMDLTLEWGSLFRGHVVGEAVMHAPVLNAVQSESTEEKQLGTGVNWPQEIRDLFPFKLNFVEIRDGFVTFLAPGISTENSMTIHEFDLRLYNLTNVQETDELAFADIELNGWIMGDTPLVLAGEIDPNAELPTFDIDLSIEGGDLVDYNPWLREFLKVDAQAGTFSMYSELAAAEGGFEGYVRPILEDPDIFDTETDDDGPFRKVWEGLVGLASKILENRAENQVATQIPLRGEIENPDAGVLAAIVNLMRNAFVAAFAHSLEGTITLRDVAGDVRCLDGAAGDDECEDDGEERRDRNEDESDSGDDDGRDRNDDESDAGDDDRRGRDDGDDSERSDDDSGDNDSPRARG